MISSAPEYISLCLSAGTSDFSAIASLSSATVLSVEIVICNLSSLGPETIILMNKNHSNEDRIPLTLITISEDVGVSEDMTISH